MYDKKIDKEWIDGFKKERTKNNISIDSLSFYTKYPKWLLVSVERYKWYVSDKMKSKMIKGLNKLKKLKEKDL